MMTDNIEQPVNIVFLDVDWVLYVGAGEDRIHRERILSNKIDDIKTHPLVVEKISKDILPDLYPFDISAALGFSPEAVYNLRKLCDVHKAKIVISSAWREGYILDEMKALFSLWDLSDYIIGLTPELSYKYNRGDEIEHWLMACPQQIKSFVILDDYEHHIPERFKDRFVHCTTLFSNHSLYQKASHILSQPCTYELSTGKLHWDIKPANNNNQETRVKNSSSQITNNQASMIPISSAVSSQEKNVAIPVQEIKNTQLMHESFQCNQNPTPLITHSFFLERPQIERKQKNSPTFTDYDGDILFHKKMEYDFLIKWIPKKVDRRCINNKDLVAWLASGNGSYYAYDYRNLYSLAILLKNKYGCDTDPPPSKIEYDAVMKYVKQNKENLRLK